MESSRDKSKLFVTESELEGKIKSKKDIHYILRQGYKTIYI